MRIWGLIWTKTKGHVGHLLSRDPLRVYYQISVLDPDAATISGKPQNTWQLWIQLWSKFIFAMSKVLTCGYPCQIPFLGCLNLWTAMHLVLSNIPADTSESNEGLQHTSRESRGCLSSATLRERCLTFLLPFGNTFRLFLSGVWACSWGTLHPATIKSYTTQYFFGISPRATMRYNGKRINRLWNLKSSLSANWLHVPLTSGLMFPSIIFVVYQMKIKVSASQGCWHDLMNPEYEQGKCPMNGKQCQGCLLLPKTSFGSSTH